MEESHDDPSAPTSIQHSPVDLTLLTALLTPYGTTSSPLSTTASAI
ncbi:MULTISPECIES: hypothetical protein [unclassified Leptolyngbya]|nr:MULTISPECIES: hypothetical protein [unclassified Leptolyngbya]MBD1911350.1 hypothetical protein [Leptolyngbya sp. FACHB-8]MBD2156632.1 hypothetical protein [Leptolyngbya sp. FACHB-16]